MKKQSFKTNFNRFVQVTVLSVLLSLSTITFTNAATVAPITNTEITSISYVGVTEEGVIINVKYDNPQGSKFDVIIKNEKGEAFLWKQFKEKNFDKNIVLAVEGGDAHLIFSIKASGVDYEQSFDINTTTTTVVDVETTNAND